MKYYQRYIEDNRILSQLGAFKETDLEDPVLAYEDHYEKTHPADNSKAGTLARITGSTKDDIETMLAVIDYYNFLADYHPEERYAFADNNQQTSDLPRAVLGWSENGVPPEKAFLKEKFFRGKFSGQDHKTPEVTSWFAILYDKRREAYIC